MTGAPVPVAGLVVSAYRIPTTAPESDGTLEWTSTTLVLVEVSGGGETGLGYTYGSDALVRFIAHELADEVTGRDAMDVVGTWERLRRAIRNNGRPGLGSMALSAVDTALWDLKARLLDLPLIELLGAVRDSVPAYGSGGFTSMSDAELQAQLGGWAAEGLGRVKMKVGRSPRDGYDLFTLARLAGAGAVDVLQVDVTRCGGITEFMRADALCAAHNLELSTHTAPAIHAHLGCAASKARDVEYFWDHVRIEQWLFDGAVAPVDGRLRPDRSRPGLGLRFRRPDVESYRVT